MDQLTEAEISICRDAFSLNDPGRKGKVPSQAVIHISHRVGFNATASEVTVPY